MRVLVTGGSGFFGAHMLSILESAGHHSIAYDVAGPGAEAIAIAPFSPARFRKGQVGDIARLMDVCETEAVDAIVHSAAVVGLEQSLAEPVTTYATNVMGLVNVCEVARQLNLRRVVSISSNAAYHPPIGDKLVESGPCFSAFEGNPAGHYGASKMIGDAIGLTYATFQNVDFLSLRVSSVYGFGMRSAVYIKPLIENAVNGVPTRLATGGSMMRDYTHVLDCCDAAMRALEAPVWKQGAQRIFNVASGVVSTASEVATLVRQIVPGADIQIGDGLTDLERSNIRMRAPLDTSAAERYLGWTRQWPLEAGLREYAATYRKFLNA